MGKKSAKQRRSKQKQNAARKERESHQRTAAMETARIQKLEEDALIQAHEKAVKKGMHSLDIQENTYRDIDLLREAGVDVPHDLITAIKESGIRRQRGKQTVITHDGNTWKAHSPSNESSSSTKKRKKKKKKKGGFKRTRTRTRTRTRKRKSTRRRY